MPVRFWEVPKKQEVDFDLLCRSVPRTVKSCNRLNDILAYEMFNNTLVGAIFGKPAEPFFKVKIPLDLYY